MRWEKIWRNTWSPDSATKPRRATPFPGPLRVSVRPKSSSRKQVFISFSKSLPNTNSYRFILLRRIDIHFNNIHLIQEVRVAYQSRQNNQSINQSIDGSINQSIKGSINQLISQSINQSSHRTIKEVKKFQSDLENSKLPSQFRALQSGHLLVLLDVNSKWPCSSQKTSGKSIM